MPSAIDRAAERRVADRAKRTGEKLTYDPSATAILEKFAAGRKSYVTAQYLASRQRFERLRSSGLSDASISENALVEFEETWDDLNSRLEMIPAKEAMGFLSHHFQTLYGVMLTASAILDAMTIRRGAGRDAPNCLICRYLQQEKPASRSKGWRRSINRVRSATPSGRGGRQRESLRTVRPPDLFCA